MKHYVRTEFWLPTCKAQLKRVRDSQRGKRMSSNFRKIRYFTFCAASALDVMLLHKEKVIRSSKNDGFNTVVFFDHNPEAVTATQETIPGSIGFPGDFARVIAGELEPLDVGDGDDPLEPSTERSDTRLTHAEQKAQNIVLTFQRYFPFDVINLDVEGYLFTPKEELPGRMVQALRHVLRWQTRTGRDETKRQFKVDSFILFFTTKLGPEDINETQRQRIAASLERNIKQYPDIKTPYEKRSNSRAPDKFLVEDFPGAFKVAIPKMLADVIYECDWYVEPKFGLRVLEFSRSYGEGNYTMLHMGMLVCRQEPPKEKRMPGDAADVSIQTAHSELLVRVFERDVLDVANAIEVGGLEAVLKKNLDQVVAHREKLKGNAASL